MENKTMDEDRFEEFYQDDGDHLRCIVHIDIDCFYAQVEMVKKPELRTIPLGIQQKNIVVTSNYEARKFGVKKCMLVSEALKVCPNLKLVSGEDLHDYRVASNKIFTIVQSFKCPVEKLGMDENFVDVTSLVSSRINDNQGADLSPSGHLFCESENIPCQCGCHERLNMASQIATEIRNKIFCDLGLTSCAGIAHNKLLAKLICGTHKPNDQTIIYPEQAIELISSLNSVRSLPSVGTKTAETLQSIGINTVKELRELDTLILRKHFSGDMAVRLKQLAVGVDNSLVKQSSTRPSSIGLEDSFRNVSVQSEVESRFSALLTRLVLLMKEDGRLPVTLRVTLRKRDMKRLSSHRESRQCQIPPSIFTLTESGVALTEMGHTKLMAIIMRLFNKLMDLTKPFHLTLVGLAFTKFRERMCGRSSIASFFMNDISVQSVLSLQNDCDNLSPFPMDISVASPSGSTTTDISDCEVEPSPKKVKRPNWIAKRRCFSGQDVASPSKLNVSDLRLNSKELEKVSQLRLSSREREPLPGNSTEKPMLCDSPKDLDDVKCPSYVDREVYNSLPEDVQMELKARWKNKSEQSKNTQKSVSSTAKTNNTILRYFIPNK